jgi:hypothetical protein
MAYRSPKSPATRKKKPVALADATSPSPTRGVIKTTSSSSKKSTPQKPKNVNVNVSGKVKVSNTAAAIAARARANQSEGTTPNKKSPTIRKTSSKGQEQHGTGTMAMPTIGRNDTSAYTGTTNVHVPLHHQPMSSTSQHIVNMNMYAHAYPNAGTMMGHNHAYGSYGDAQAHAHTVMNPIYAEYNNHNYGMLANLHQYNLQRQIQSQYDYATSSTVNGNGTAFRSSVPFNNGQGQHAHGVLRLPTDGSAFPGATSMSPEEARVRHLQSELKNRLAAASAFNAQTVPGPGHPNMNIQPPHHPRRPQVTVPAAHASSSTSISMTSQKPNTGTSSFFKGCYIPPPKKVINVKKEKALQKLQQESQPQNAQESNVLNQLRSMGFGDAPATLSAIRTVIAKNEEEQHKGGGNDDDDNVDEEVTIVPGLQQLVDQSMMFLLSQKEEQEEAAMLDRARISSERDQDQTAHKAASKERDLVNGTASSNNNKEGGGQSTSTSSEETQSLSSLQSYFHTSELLKHAGVLGVLGQIYTWQKQQQPVTPPQIYTWQKQQPPVTPPSKSKGSAKSKSKPAVTSRSSTSKKGCDSDAVDEIKRHVVELLLLEQKALRWYGNSHYCGATSYFLFVLAPCLVRAMHVHVEEKEVKAGSNMNHPKGCGTPSRTMTTDRSDADEDEAPGTPLFKRLRSPKEVATTRKSKRMSGSPSKNEDSGDGENSSDDEALARKQKAGTRSATSAARSRSIRKSSSSSVKKEKDLQLNQKKASIVALSKYLKEQLATIQRGLYSLDEQEGSIPKIFAQANRDAKTHGWWSESELQDKMDCAAAGSGSGEANSKDDHDDDDDSSIEILEMDNASVPLHQKSIAEALSQARKDIEVIDLLDE